MQAVLELPGEDQPRKLGCFTGVRILSGKSKEIVGIGVGGMVKKASSRSRIIIWEIEEGIWENSSYINNPEGPGLSGKNLHALV